STRYSTARSPAGPQRSCSSTRRASTALLRRRAASPTCSVCRRVAFRSRSCAGETTSRRSCRGSRRRTRRMARTAAFAIPLGILLAWSWSRLELPRTGLWPLLLMVALGVAPAFLPTRRWRLAGLGVALLLAAAFALDARPYALGTLLHKAGRGFLDFY